MSNEIIEKVKCQMCGRDEHCNGAAGYPEGCFHPDYHKVKLSDKIEHATFTGNPSDETIKLVNKIADKAYNSINYPPMIQLPIPRMFIVEVPRDAGEIVLEGYNLTEEYSTVSNKNCGWFIPLHPVSPRSHYTIISTDIAAIDESQAATICDTLYICPCCGGDGKETCNNPDHGFLSAISFRGANESRCPCCGHDENHKVPNGGSCEVCNGTGECDLEQVIEFEKEVEHDFDPDVKRTSLQVLHSAFDSVGVEWRNEIEEPIHSEYVPAYLNDNFNRRNKQEEYEMDLAAWHEAESKVKRYCLIIKN